MTNTALQITAAAFNDCGMDQALTSYSMLEWPYSIALDVTNNAIAEINRAGSFSFAESSQTLTYANGVYTYNLNTVVTSVIEPRRIMRVRRELAGQAGELTEYNFRDFQKRFMNSTVSTMKPIAWAKYGGTLYLNSIPDQDYSLNIYYYSQVQPIVVGTNDNSATIFPLYHEDVLRDMIKALLLKELERPDFVNQYTLAIKKVQALVARSQEDVGIPASFPRAF